MVVLVSAISVCSRAGDSGPNHVFSVLAFVVGLESPVYLARPETPARACFWAVLASVDGPETLGLRPETLVRSLRPYRPESPVL